MKNLLTTLLLALLIGGNVNGQSARKWFKTSMWKTDFPYKIKADMNEFCKQNQINAADWQACYHFLRDSTLLTMPTGRYTLTNDGVYANVTDYTTKDTPETRQYEAHRRYIDVQYIAGGEEAMQMVPLKNIKEQRTYSEKSDVVHYKAEGVKAAHYVAEHGTVYIFFPSDAHKTNMKVDGKPCRVRKIVVKVPYRQE
jgi:YhcH/YjgK/YiaL family protein